MGRDIVSGIKHEPRYKLPPLSQNIKQQGKLRILPRRGIMKNYMYLIPDKTKGNLSMQTEFSEDDRCFWQILTEDER